MVWKPATPQLKLVLPGAPASQFHSTDVEPRARQTKRAGSLIRQALYLDQEDAYAAGEVGFLARALVQATLPHSDPKANGATPARHDPLGLAGTQVRVAVLQSPAPRETVPGLPAGDHRVLPRSEAREFGCRAGTQAVTGPCGEARGGEALASDPIGDWRPAVCLDDFALAEVGCRARAPECRLQHPLGGILGHGIELRI